MAQSTSSEANRSSPSQEIPHTSLNPKVSLLHSQELFSELDQSSPCPLHPQFLKTHFNIILPSTPRPSKWSFFLRLHHKNPVCTSPLPHRCCMSHTSHPFSGSIPTVLQPPSNRSTVQFSRILVDSRTELIHNRKQSVEIRLYHVGKLWEITQSACFTI